MPPWDSQPRSAAWFCPSIETLGRHQREMRWHRDACGVNKPNSCGEAPARQRRPAWRYHPCVCVYLSAHVCLEELVPSHSARAQAARHARHCQLPVHQPGQDSTSPDASSVKQRESVTACLPSAQAQFILHLLWQFPTCTSTSVCVHVSGCLPASRILEE